MSVAAPLVSIAVGVVVERSKGASQWTDFLWRPVDVLLGAPETPPWTRLSGDDDRATFFVGTTDVELHRTETSNYLENLATGEPKLWVVLQPVEGEPPYELALVTADPAEGEAMTEAGANLVDTVPMPAPLRETLVTFVAVHHDDQKFVKRKRDRANPEALGRRTPTRGAPE